MGDFHRQGLAREYALVGHWPSGRLPHRLVSDEGGYNEFSP